MQIELPQLALVVLIGTSGAGKSTFAARHFAGTEVLSSDFCRGLVSDDPNSQAATRDAFDVLHYIAAKRLQRGLLTVVDATSVQREDRSSYIALAREYHVLPVAIVLNVPPATAIARNRARADRTFGEYVLKRQYAALKRSLSTLKQEGFRRIFVLDAAAVEQVNITRAPLWNDLRNEHGPFDIIGDVHGCADELESLLAQLGYMAEVDPTALHYQRLFCHPDGRKAVFLGDLVDRGPRSIDTLCLVRNMVVAGQALAVPGNHDIKLLRWLRGRNVKLTHGMAQTVAEFTALPAAVQEPLKAQMADFVDGLVSHYQLDDGRLVVAHAGMKEAMQGRASGRVREFALYGETTDETDEYGLPVRYPWAESYRGAAMVVYGHTPVPQPEWLNNTINIDTGCVFGGSLTALRYPERELVAVPAAQMYAEPARPIAPPSTARSLQQQADELLDLENVLGKRLISTRLRSNLTIRAENSAAALEVMSRFAVDARWLIYLPPTMSPVATSQHNDLLEHPDEAFDLYRQARVAQVICEEKHMGSRAIAVICRDQAAAEARFGVQDADGTLYTRTGRRFFDNLTLEAALLARLRAALDRCDFWQRFETDWVCLDCELMPWSTKAQALLNEQYAATAAAAETTLALSLNLLNEAGRAGRDAAALTGRYADRATAVRDFRAAYRHYAWPVADVADLRLAPFHILATEDRAHVDKTHLWHMQEIGRIASGDDPVLLQTDFRSVRLDQPDEIEAAVAWWNERTAHGSEGMVVKPLDFITQNREGLVQPAIKVRGKQYLRIVYGPEYDLPGNLERLRARSLNRKQSLALREFALGVEALERFVAREPLRRVHECVFSILALESEPVDPRL